MYLIGRYVVDDFIKWVSAYIRRQISAIVRRYRRVAETLRVLSMVVFCFASGKSACVHKELELRIVRGNVEGLAMSRYKKVAVVADPRENGA